MMHWSKRLAAIFTMDQCPVSDALAVRDLAKRMRQGFSQGYRVQILRGPPGCGKSTLCDAVKAENKNAVYFRSADKALMAFDSDEQKFLSKLTIVDDAQVMYTKERYDDLLNFFKAQSSTKLLLSGTFAGAPTSFPQVEHYFLSGVFASKEATRTWFADRVALIKGVPWTKQQIDRFVDIALMTSCHHVGFLQSIGAQLERRVELGKLVSFDEKAVSEFIITSMKEHRLLKANGKNDVSSNDVRDVVADVLLQGEAQCVFLPRLDATEAAQATASRMCQAVSGGLFFPKNTLQKPSVGLLRVGAVGATEIATTVTLAHPVQWEFSAPHVNVRTSLTAKMAHVQTDLPTTALDLVLFGLPALPWKAFFDSYRKTGKAAVGERAFRDHVFNPTLKGLLRGAITTHDEVQGRGKSSLDNVYTIGSKNFGIEFFKHHDFQSGAFIKAFINHHLRWGAGYKQLRKTYSSYATVAIVGPLTNPPGASDIRKVFDDVKAMQLKKKWNTAHPWVIVTLSAHSEYTVFYGENLEEVRKVCLVRNGVPQKLKNHRCVPARRVNTGPRSYYARVKLPDGSGSTVSTDIASTLNKEGLSLTVDGLKKAVLKELAVELQGKGISHLTVYPPAAKKGPTPYATGASVGGISTPLQNAPLKAPYHVVVS